MPALNALSEVQASVFGAAVTWLDFPAFEPLGSCPTASLAIGFILLLRRVELPT